MHLKRNILALLRYLGINLLLLTVAAGFDLLLAVFSFPSFTVACFAVAGVFSAVLGFSTTIKQTAKEQTKGAVITLLLWISVLCALLWIVIAPLSTVEYNGPVKFFAAVQLVTAIFLWKSKLYEDVAPAGKKQNHEEKSDESSIKI